MTFRALEKEKLVNAFLRGESVTDLSAFFACKRVTIEDVLREAIVQLAQLKVGKPDVTEEEAMMASDGEGWRKGVVIRHEQRHTNDNATGDDPPWIRTVRLEDGTEQTFDWGHLCRDRTFESNTREGMTVWVNKRGAISVHIKEEALPHE